MWGEKEKKKKKKAKFTYKELLVVAQKAKSVKNGKGKGLCGGRGQ